MKRKYLHLAMYRAMDCLYEEQENPSEALLQFISDANPYLYKERVAVDSALQAEFNESMNHQNIGQNVDTESAYYAVKNFLTEQNPQFAEMFSDISLEEWEELCTIIENEEKKLS